MELSSAIRRAIRRDEPVVVDGITLYPIRVAEYEEFFQVLKNGRYDGRVSVEAYSDEPEQDIENAVFLRDYL